MSKCSVCGEPMPAGEEMFKFHGYSGPCPKPPLPRLGISVSMKGREDAAGLWLEIYVDAERHTEIGPFTSEEARRSAYDDFVGLLKSVALPSGNA